MINILVWFSPPVQEQPYNSRTTATHLQTSGSGVTLDKFKSENREKTGLKQECILDQAGS